MNESQSYTESLLNVVTGIKNQTILLPEFQRDFRWELEQTHDLFDSLVRDIFIGTIIYGKPAFAMTPREIDQRPRKGKGNTLPLKTHDYSAAQLSTLVQTKNLCIVLDGQQRITSIYRAIMSIDRVYVILHPHLDPGTITKLSLEEFEAGQSGI